MSANVRLGRTKIAFVTINDAIFGLENIITVYLAARMTLADTLTIGMIFAFMSYKQNFRERAVQLVEKALDFRILELHLERLGDIALSQLERGHDQLLEYTRPIEGRIELRNVFFQYAETEPFVLQNFSLVIEPGEFVTITGQYAHRRHGKLAFGGPEAACPAGPGALSATTHPFLRRRHSAPRR